MNREVNKAVSFTDIASVIRRRKWLICLSLIVTVAPVLIYNQKTVPVYRGSTKVIFEDNETSMENYMFGGMTQGNLISNQIEEMRTNSFAEEILRELPTKTRNKFSLLSSYAPELELESFTVGAIMHNLSFQPIRGTEIIGIEFDAEDRELAQTVANTAATVLIKRNLKIRRQQYSNVKTFIEQQFDIVKSRLEDAEESLKEFKEREKITSIEDESREILQRSTQAEIVYNEVQTRKKELQERLTAIQTKLESEKRDLTKNIVKTSSPMAVRLKERLVELEITYSNLQVQGFPIDNPKMIDLKNEVEQVKKNLVQETLKINNEENMESLIDPFSQITKFLEETISLEVELQALGAKERNLRVLLASYSRLLRTLPAKELNLVRLLRDKEVNNKLYMTLLEEREQARIKEASEIGNIRILEPARFPVKPIRPQKALNLIGGTIAGIFLGVLLIFVLEYLNDQIRSPDDVEKDIGLPVIAVIPKDKKALDGMFNLKRNNGTLFHSTFYDSIFFDAYNLLSFALDNQRKSTTVMLTSSVPDEGKSTISSMLAVTSAQRGKKTLLIDADLRKPSLNSLFGVPREPGLTNLVIEMMQMQKRYSAVKENGRTAPPQEGSEVTLLNSQMLQTSLVEGLIQTFEKNLLFLPSGFIPANPVRIWSSPIWSKIFHHLNSIVDLIIIDAPPIIGVAETTMMAMHMDNILLCVAAEGVDKKTLKRSFKMFQDSIPNSEEKILGVVLNKTDMVNMYGGYKYHRYYSKKDKSRKRPEVPSVDFRRQVVNENKKMG